MSILYIEPFSGISGDMLLGSLCGLLDNYEIIKMLPDQLSLKDAKVNVKEVNKNGISCKHVKVIDLGEAISKQHRKLKEILQIIDNGNISDKAKETAKRIFSIIGESESRIHNMSLEEIHFHELSGVDSIIDIVGCAVLLDTLDVEKTYSDPICTGYGTVNTQHGVLPVPAPATADMLIGLPCYKGDEEGEKVTPTGAAILKYLEPEFIIPISVKNKIAYGPGEKDFKNPNVLRMSIIDILDKEDDEALYVVESNIDDTRAEYLGSDFQSNLMKSGATDFYFTPVQMKKGRPGQKISALTSVGNLKNVCDFILENTSTIGVRYYKVSRDILERKSYEIKTKYGKVQVKEVIRPSGNKDFKIEYESLKELSAKNNINIQQLESELIHFISNKK